MIDRATEQEKLNAPSNNTIHSNVTQQLDLNFYLGIYGGMIVPWRAFVRFNISGCFSHLDCLSYQV